MESDTIANVGAALVLLAPATLGYAYVLAWVSAGSRGTFVAAAVWVAFCVGLLLIAAAGDGDDDIDLVARGDRP